MLVGADGGPDCSTHCATDNGAFASTYLVTDGGTCGTADTAADRRITGRIICMRPCSGEYNSQYKILNLHEIYTLVWVIQYPYHRHLFVNV